MLSIDSSVLLGYYQAKTGQAVTAFDTNASSGSLALGGAKKAPTPPWDTSAHAPNASALVKQVLAGHNFIDPNASKLDVAGASSDYGKLFSLYQGLNALEGLAAQMSGKGVSSLQQSQIESTFQRGVSQISSYVDALKLDGLRLTLGATGTKAATTVGVPADNETYTTGVIQTGPLTNTVAAFQGDVKFNIHAKRVNDSVDVAIDLGDMGSTPRTLPNVVNFINAKLKDAGLVTKFATNQLPSAPSTIKVGSQTITLPDAPQQWGWKVVGDSIEQISFSAPQTSGAVYLAQTVGTPPSTTTGVTSPSTATPPAPQQRQLLKFQTDTTTGTAAPDALASPGTVNKVDGEAFARTLGSEVGAVHATAAGPDGSVYVLADVTGTTSGQTIQGAQDVALMKYDSAGKLIYTRTLGTGGTASGLALSVSADGHVAVAGSVTGVLTPGDSGADPAATDSFVTVFNAAGEESWTQRRAARADDQANAVAFGADGSVYVAGQAGSTMPGATSQGGTDGYLQGFSATGAALFTREFGTSATDKATALTVDGTTVYVGSVDNGHGVVRSYDVSTPAAPVLSATRDLGDLKGGSIAGLAMDSGELVVAGSSGSGTLDAGTATIDYTGGQDAFVAKLSGSLTANASDRIAYFGGAGQDTATGLAVSNGQIWLTGASTGDLPGMAKVGTKDGYLARIDVDGGAVDWSRRFTGQDGQVAPSAIAIDPAGASVLDRLGLPTGTLQTSDSQLLTAATSVRAGDQFQIRTRAGGPFSTVTIAQDDTLASLSLKIQRATSFQANVSVVTLNGHRTLQIKPLNTRVSLEILPGKGGQNALDALGLTPGVVQTTPTAKSGGPAPIKAYGLNLPDTLDLGTPAGIAAAQKALLAALSTVRTAYRDLSTPVSTATAKPAITGTAPAYLTAQIANYQAGLDRLTGGSTSFTLT